MSELKDNFDRGSIVTKENKSA